MTTLGKLKVGKISGTCSNCGRTYFSDRPAPQFVVCQCYKYCPQCGTLMTPFSNDLGMKTGESKLAVLYVCYNCNPPCYSKQEPIEVQLE